MKKVITNIEEVKKQIPALIRKCLSYFMGVDRTVEGWEGLLAAQECLPTNKEKDEFAADYRVLNRAWTRYHLIHSLINTNSTMYGSARSISL